MRQAFDQLRLLAVSDPRAARELLVSLLDGESTKLEELLRRLSAPGEGRLRQLVANAVRSRSDKNKVVPFLLRWLELETDEFARGAIAASLKDVDESRHRENHSLDNVGTAPDRLPDLVDTYRYVAGRLCHRVRNALPASSVQIRRIESLAKSAIEPLRGELLASLGQLKDALRGVSRIVEFETNDTYFEWKSISVCSWLNIFSKAYSLSNEAITLTFRRIPEEGEAIIRGNEYLLETIFWNLWKNAGQAVTGACVVSLDVEVKNSQLLLTIYDNGEGIPEHLFGVAFEETYSTNGQGRGRGLLEVQDAVRRLSGSASLTERPIGGYGVMLSFPQEQA